MVSETLGIKVPAALIRTIPSIIATPFWFVLAVTRVVAAAVWKESNILGVALKVFI